MVARQQVQACVSATTTAHGNSGKARAYCVHVDQPRHETVAREIDCFACRVLASRIFSRKHVHDLAVCDGDAVVLQKLVCADEPGNRNACDAVSHPVPAIASNLPRQSLNGGALLRCVCSGARSPSTGMMKRALMSVSQEQALAMPAVHLSPTLSTARLAWPWAVGAARRHQPEGPGAQWAGRGDDGGSLLRDRDPSREHTQ